MSEVRDNYLYSEEHEWVRKTDAGTLLVGISDFAQHQLGDIVFVELPEEGSVVTAGEGIGTIESVKTVSDLFAPVGGTIVKVNGALEASPELVNSSPYEEGWMIEIKLDDSAEEDLAKLLSPEAYTSHVAD